MKTFTSRLSIFALLISMNASSINTNSEITPPIRISKPGFENVLENDLLSIVPPIRNSKPGFESVLENNLLSIVPPIRNSKPGFEI